MHLALAGGRLWRKLTSICEHKRAPVEHIILFFHSGDLVSEVWVDMSVEKRFRRCVDPCQRCLTLDTHAIYALCVWAKSTRALFSREWSAFIVSLFSVGKSSALGCPVFSRELRQSSASRGSGLAAAEAVKRLSSRRSQMKLANEFEREKKWFFHLALDSGWREWTAGGRCIVCYIFWSSRKCFAGSWCASRDVELLEVMKRALLLGKPTVDARKRGSGSQ